MPTLHPHAHAFVLHGVIILFSGLIGGYFHARAIKQNQNEVPWRVVHSGGSIGGVMLIALSWALHFTTLSSLLQTTLLWTNLAGTYLLILGMWLAALSGQRGIAPGGSALNRIIRALYGIGAVLSLLGLALFLHGLLSSA